MEDLGDAGTFRGSGLGVLVSRDTLWGRVLTQLFFVGLFIADVHLKKKKSTSRSLFENLERCVLCTSVG